MTESKDPMLSIVVLNFNVKDFLEHLLTSLERASSTIQTEIFVVDNASYDGSPDMIKEKFPYVHLIINEQNLGFSKGNNIALDQCRGKYVLVINPDVVVQEDTLSQLINFMDLHPETGAATCKVLNADGTLQLSCRRSFPTPLVALWKITGLADLFPKSKHFGKYNLTYLDENKVHEVEAISGSFMFLRRQVIAEIGKLDERFFMYGEDLDWCYRIWKAGWKIFYVPTTQIIHYKGESTARSGFDDIRMFYEAMEVFVEKHFKKRYSLWMIALLKFAIGLRAFAAKITRSIRIAWMPLADMISVQSAVLLSIYLKYEHLVTPDWIGTPVFFYTTILLTTSMVWLSILYFLDNYNKRTLSISHSILASVIGFFVISTISLFSKEFVFSRMVVLMTFLFALFFTTGWRIVALFVLKRGSHRRLWSMKVFKRNTLIVGTDEQAVHLRNRIQQRVDSPYNIIGFVGTHSAEHHSGITVLGSIRDLTRLIRFHKIPEVIICSSSASNTMIMGIIQMLRDLSVNVRLAPVGTEVIIGKSFVSKLEPVPLLSIESESDNPLNRLLKRGFDIMAGIIAWFFMIPAFIVQLIRLKLKRTTFYFSAHGKKTIKVRCWSRDSAHPFISSLFWLVIRGHLSFVGPPPRWRTTSESDQNLPPSFISRRPGLISLFDVMTDGLAQPDDTLQMNYDFYYVNNYSFKMDIEILIRRIFRI